MVRPCLGAGDDDLSDESRHHRTARRQVTRATLDPIVIPLVDVKAQYAPLIPELKERFAEVLESGRFIFGPEVEAFERESAAFLGVPHAIGVSVWLASARSSSQHRKTL